MDSAEGRGVLAEYLTGTVFGAVQTEAPVLGFTGKLAAWVLTAGLSLVCDWITHGTTPLQGLPGMCFMVLATATGRKIPAACWVSIVAMFMTSPLCPWAAQIAALSAKNDFLGVTTPC